MTTDPHLEPTEPEAPERVPRRVLLKTLGGAAAVGVAGITAYALLTSNAPAGALDCKYRAGEIPLDPKSAVWTRRPVFVVSLLKQNIATPNALELAIPELRVRSIHNGKQIAFHIEWVDPTKDEIDAVARFHDAVAVQLGTDAAADSPITMGGPTSAVHILQWKASWQADIDSGQKTVKDAFPNMYNDVLPEQWMTAEQAKAFYPAWAVGNALAQRDKKSPVEELAAVGFGTLTTHAEQEATGKGVHDGKRWRVVIARPMQPTGSSKAKIVPGETRSVAFAVWSGSHSQRGGRKQYAPWTALNIGGVA